MSITAANATIFLSIANLYTTPVPLQGFAADDIFDTEAIDVAETLMGVDGTLTAGFVWVPTMWSITFQADSASNAIFDAWRQAEISAQEKYPASGIVMLTSLGTQWALTNGYLKKFQPLPNASKVRHRVAARQPEPDRLILWAGAARQFKHGATIWRGRRRRS